MKHIIRIFAVAAIFFFSNGAMNAQKVAHIDLDSLLKIMPDYQKIKDSLTRYSVSVQNTMMQMEQEYLVKAQELDSLRKTLSPLMIQLREKQLQDMQQNYAAFAQAAEQEVAVIQNNLVDPLYKKVEKAIADVAKEKGYKYVLDSSKGGPVLFSDPTDDIFEAVRIKLGVPKPAAPTPAPGTPAPGK